MSFRIRKSDIKTWVIGRTAIGGEGRGIGSETIGCKMKIEVR